MAEEQVHYSNIKDIPSSSWEKLAKKKIYFGHQSVGNNIIEDIRNLMKENPEIKLNIVKTNDPADFKSGIFAHSSIGKNDAPQTKIDAFADYVNKGIGKEADIAFFKFCFADITGLTDAKSIFDSYRKTMSELKKKYPQTTFIHITVPVVITKKSLKARLKRLFGKKDIWFYDGNIKRNELNELFTKEFKGREPLYDLAAIEASHPDGRMEIFTENGKSYFALVPDYTDDSAHLNEKGRRKVAEQLLILLANLN